MASPQKIHKPCIPHNVTLFGNVPGSSLGRIQGYPQDERRRREKTRETSLDGAKSARERGRGGEREERESDQTGGAESGNALFFTMAFIP